MKTLLILPGGEEISSGVSGQCAVKSFQWTQCVNDSQELTLGSVCSAMVEMTILDAAQELNISAGDEILVYRQDLQGLGYKVGVFITQTPTRPTPTSLKLTAYDRVSLLDKDLTQWLEDLKEWPYTLRKFADLVCQACGVTLLDRELPNGDYAVGKFYAQGVTGRQLMGWIGQLTGRFCRCTSDGELEFAWYRENPLTIGEGERYYFQNGLAFEDYQVAPVDGVLIHQNENDVGTRYPEGAAENAYTITGNPMAAANTASSLTGIAQTLYEQLQGITYTPCRVALPGGFNFSAGDIVHIRQNGKDISAYVMTKRQTGDKDTLESTGSPSRNSPMAVNGVQYKALSGKVMNLSVTVEGLKAENREAEEKTASLKLNVEGISSEVSRQQIQMETVKTQLTQLEQTGEAMQIRIRTLAEQGADRVTTQTGFTFDEKGLTISKTGTAMENLLDESGMYVKRSGEVLLQADQDGVKAVDVSVGNYLIVGDHARFENFSTDRTACFWI